MDLVLNPEIRLAKAVSEFEALLAAEQKAEFRSSRIQFAASPPTLTDVMQTTAEVDSIVAKKGERSNFVGPRLINFLQSVQGFAAIDGRVAGGPQALVARGVWTLVRMTLLELVGLTVDLEKMSTLFMSIGRSAPQYPHMAPIYSRSEKLQPLLFEYFVVVVRVFHHLQTFMQTFTAVRSYSSMARSVEDPQMKSYESELESWTKKIKYEVDASMNEVAFVQDDSFSGNNFSPATEKEGDGIQESEGATEEEKGSWTSDNAPPERLKEVAEVLTSFSQSKPFSFETEPLQDIEHGPTTPTATITDSAYVSASFVDSSGMPKSNTLVSGELSEESTGHDIDDLATEYSYASSTTSSRQKVYILELANDLYDRIKPEDPGQITQEKVDAVLPKLLKAFALKVGHCAPTQMHRDVMAFVHKYRREITTAFMTICLSGDEVGDTNLQERMDHWEKDEEIEKASLEEDCMNLQERMDLWEKDEDIEHTPAEEELESLGLEAEAEEEEEDDTENVGTWLAAYREFAPNTEAYSWLLIQLQRDLISPVELSAIRDIRDQILSSLPSPQSISRRMPSRSCFARFELDWDILGFFETQKYSNPPDQVLPGIITITGSSCDAQAMTCAQYLDQTWPATGNSMIKLLQRVLQGEEGHTQFCNFPDGTFLRARALDSQLIVRAKGADASISEIGEQLAWLGAALRNSPRQNGLTYCTPIITAIYQNSTTQADPAIELPDSDIACNIGFKIDQVPPPRHFANGHCWHHIFKNPIIVRGYPFLPRKEQNTGLDIPLNIMAGLARARRIDLFNEQVYIKGFSTMLIPTKQDQSTVYWHLIYKEDGSRISYLDDALDHECDISLLDLTTTRHVLGWCSEANFYAGSAQAHYNVKHSELPKANAECALAGIIVSLGKMITGGSSFELGIRDTPVHVSRNGYIPQLKWISSKFVLLWDEQDKRGWLINGTSALLHVVRASLAYDSTDKFKSAFLFKSADLEESQKPFTPDSAIDMLINSKNLGLNLYPEKDGYIVLKHRIDQFYNLMEKMLDHQTGITRRSNESMMAKPRRYLEGWDFKDLATSRDPLHPRVATLESAGKGWVELTRALHAVTLVGSGFGEIFKPVSPNLCQSWATLPKQRYVIASCVSDLEPIVRDHRSCTDEHVRLSDDLIWHTPTTFGKCQGICVMRDHGDLVQTIFPSALSHKLFPRKSPLSLEGNGVVIFGHNPSFPWIWGDTGHPVQGPLPDEGPKATPVDAMDKDSGIGPSFASSGSEGRGPSFEGAGSFLLTTSMSEPAAPWSGDQRFARDQYTIGILCALPIELKAVRALFDERHQTLTSIIGDDNQYVLGKMAQHMVVAASLPSGEYGTNAAASAVSDMMRSFVSLQFCLLVGIAGGAPSEENDIRLGDVVVSLPTKTYPGVIQYDLGKENEGSQFEPTGVLRRPPRVLTNAISKLQSDPDLDINPLDLHLAKIIGSLPTYGSPGRDLDVLFRASCLRKTCTEGCSHLEQRPPRPTTEPRIHYGLVASGNRVVKDAVLRDKLEREYGMLCFEMEAAGVMNRANCLVIRGICDYCDAQKNKTWQNYAAATAAAYAKLLLGAVAVNDDPFGSSVRDDDRPISKRRKVEADYIY
ncbi:hypothetical protein F53441_11645 [Fusarium austroafricanum]|uniref:Nucleoside phosphorylase domain-containing protein n=1 Tax=Fusarium austroafricanum TaxID=2364996 RepID=A0A8H4NZ30_9HYPO|nr:hypothetical protein F53441_11645 [Fusarium austroafricanum]